MQRCYSLALSGSNPYSSGLYSPRTNTDSINVTDTARETQNISSLSGPTVLRVLLGLENTIVSVATHTPRIGSR